MASYLHIEQLYKSQDILLFRECYALEKVHGESASLEWKSGEFSFSSGSLSESRFKSMFALGTLQNSIRDLGKETVNIYGELYGGKLQHMSHIYGKEVCFIVLDIQIDGFWLSVPNMVDVANKLNLEVVPYTKVSTDMATLDAERDKPSEVSVRRGISGVHQREGVVLRPLIELTKNNGMRLIAKHRIHEMSERATPQEVSPEQLKILADAVAIANEWVVPNRLQHILQKLPLPHDARQTGEVIRAMVEDVLREAAGEIVDSKDARKAIGRKASELFGQYVKENP